jgi:hypothetical protein
MLALNEAETLAQHIRHVKGDRHRITRFTLDAGDAQRMEFAHGTECRAASDTPLRRHHCASG